MTFQFHDGTVKTPAKDPTGQSPEAVAFCIHDIQDYIKSKIDNLPKEERLNARLNYVAGAALYAQVYMETMPEELQVQFMGALIVLKERITVVKLSELEKQENKS